MRKENGKMETEERKREKREPKGGKLNPVCTRLFNGGVGQAMAAWSEFICLTEIERKQEGQKFVHREEDDA